MMGKRMDSNEKHSPPQDVLDTFRRLQSFGTSAGWSVESHEKLPLFTIEDVKLTLFFSPDKGLDGEHLCSHQPECLLIVCWKTHAWRWDEPVGSRPDFSFVWAKCRRLQDTSSPPHICIVCIGCEEVISVLLYGAHCHCDLLWAGACSPVAAHCHCGWWKTSLQEVLTSEAPLAVRYRKYMVYAMFSGGWGSIILGSKFRESCFGKEEEKAMVCYGLGTKFPIVQQATLPRLTLCLPLYWKLAGKNHWEQSMARNFTVLWCLYDEKSC